MPHVLITGGPELPAAGAFFQPQTFRDGEFILAIKRVFIALDGQQLDLRFTDLPGVQQAVGEMRMRLERRMAPLGVLIMSVMVTPLGVLAAFYLREYARCLALASAVLIPDPAGSKSADPKIPATKEEA
jgi:hypothetical protein